MLKVSWGSMPPRNIWWQIAPLRDFFLPRTLSMAGEMVPLQLLYTGVTDRCH